MKRFSIIAVLILVLLVGTAWAQPVITPSITAAIAAWATTGSIGGNAATATKLATARAINGVNFDGTTPITIPNLILSYPSSDLGYNGSYITATAGENVAIGDVCYLKSDGKYWLSKADVATTKMPGVALATGTISANASGIFLLQGFIRNDAWTTAVFGNYGSLLYATITGTTGNTIHKTAPVATGNIVQVLGQTYGFPAAAIATTIADGAAGLCTVGNHTVKISFITAAGETIPGTASNTLSSAGTVVIGVSGIPTGPPGTTGRNIYMNEAAGATWYKVTSGATPVLNNNTATTVNINVADATLAGYTAAPSADTTAKVIYFNPNATQVTVP